MTEQFRPHPDNPKQNSPEVGAGPLGIPPPDPEQARIDVGEGSRAFSITQGEQQPYGGGVNNPEIHPPEEESEELAKNEEFLKKLTRLTSLPPFSEDFYKRLGERLKQISQAPKQEK